MVELGLLVYSVAMSGVWLRTYQGCVGKKDDGHLIIYDVGVYDFLKARHIKYTSLEIIKHVPTVYKSCKSDWRWAWISYRVILYIKSLFFLSDEIIGYIETWKLSTSDSRTMEVARKMSRYTLKIAVFRSCSIKKSHIVNILDSMQSNRPQRTNMTDHLLTETSRHCVLNLKPKHVTFVWDFVIGKRTVNTV